ncbi:hypothetical protein ABEB36_004928 [Hypothenemus hampei]|uniref:STAGA complex 65 subunit gamma n=1 Tax=Hypothenemus hampei TaxID=57062 RepID=A0ABD1EXC4_HYPHA
MSDSDNESNLVVQHWGEIPNRVPEDEEESKNVPDISEVIRKSMNHSCLEQFQDDENIMQIQDFNLNSTDPHVLYAIQLHKWMNNMVETIKSAEIASESNIMLPEDAKIPIPKTPNEILEFRRKLLKAKKHNMELKKIEMVDVPELSESMVKQLLVKCVALMTAHIGFEDSYQSVLDVLVDVLDQFFVKICDRFTQALHEEEDLNAGGFANVLERVLVEMGFGGVSGLHNYYQNRVVKYVRKLEKRCQVLEKEYLSLLIPKAESPIEQIGS